MLSQHSVTSCADQVLITSDECVLVPVRAEWRRTQEQSSCSFCSDPEAAETRGTLCFTSTKSLSGCFRERALTACRSERECVCGGECHFLSSFLDPYFDSCVLELYHGATRFFFRGAMKSNVNRNEFTELSTRWTTALPSATSSHYGPFNM